MQHPVEPVVADQTIHPPGWAPALGGSMFSRANEIVLPPVLLRPTLPSHQSRYDPRPVSGWCGSVIDVVPPNTRPSNTTKFSQLPDGWEEYTHPEGDTYFRHRKLSIVTNTNLRLPSYEQVLIMAHDHLMELGGAMDLDLRDREVFIQVTEKTPFINEAVYYFIDHDNRLPFWVHDVLVQDIGLHGIETSDHIWAALAPEYWVHMDYFPTHQVLDTALEAELIAIFRHGCADTMTSYGSTFPYGALDCREFLRTLEGFVASGLSSSYRTSTFARLWASITRARHANGYSLRQPRLDRLQGLEDFQKSQRSNLALRLAETITLGLSRSTFDRLTELWNGRVVYQRHWHQFFDEEQKEWMRLAALSSVIFIGAVNFICGSGPKPFAVASASVSFASVMSALSLYGSYNRGRFKTASDISSWISAVESPRSGLLPLAIKFTVPQATAIYSAFLLLLALLKLAADSLRDSDSAINSALFLAAAFGPAITVYLMLRVDTWNGVSDPSEQLVDARESRCDGLGM